MYLSVASSKLLTLSKFDKVAALYRLHFRSGWGILVNLGMNKCGYPLAKKDTILRAIAHNTHEILARELVSIYEVKIPAK